MASALRVFRPRLLDQSEVGFARHRGAHTVTVTTAARSVVLAETSWQRSDGLSPMLEAHPGSMAAAQPYPTGPGTARSQRAMTAKMAEEGLYGDGVAKNGSISSRESEIDPSPLQQRRMQVAGPQLLSNPKVPEQDEIHVRPISVTGRLFVDGAAGPSQLDQSLNFASENGVWMSAMPLARESRTAIITTTTGNVTLVEDRIPLSAALILNTSVGKSSVNMSSSAASTDSATTATSFDVYGWEKEAANRLSVDAKQQVQPGLMSRGVPRSFTSEGWTVPSRHASRISLPLGSTLGLAGTAAVDGKGRSLLYRLLNIFGG